MQRVRVIHWKPAEAEPLLEVCRAAGFAVEFEAGDLPAMARVVRRTLPDALVIDLTRMPSAGRELAFAIRHTKYMRHIPLIFVDGMPEKVEAVREKLPDATFCNRTRVPAAIRAAIRNPAVVPVAPPTVMERYGSRTTAQKLGITEGMTVALLDAPRDYATVLGTLPDHVELSEDSEGIQAVMLWFVRDPRAYQSELSRMRRLASRSKLWVIWRKGSTNGLTQNLIRESAIEAGLVDYKICSVDAQWSGILFAVKKS